MEILTFIWGIHWILFHGGSATLILSDASFTITLLIYYCILIFTSSNGNFGSLHDDIKYSWVNADLIASMAYTWTREVCNLIDFCHVTFLAHIIVVRINDGVYPVPVILYCSLTRPAGGNRDDRSTYSLPMTHHQRGDSKLLYTNWEAYHNYWSIILCLAHTILRRFV